MSAVPRCQTNRMPGKEKVVSTRICGETSCNQILARFLLVKSATKGLNVLYNPFRERTPFSTEVGQGRQSEVRNHFLIRGFPARGRPFPETMIRASVIAKSQSILTEELEMRPYWETTVTRPEKY